MKNNKTDHQIIIDTISAEADTLMSLLSVSLESVLSAADLIKVSTGRVIITGIGKSAIVARKLTATLNSIGTSSIYLHAGDAVHGDLGVIRSIDVAIIISKSGNSDEVVNLVGELKRRGVQVIAMVSNAFGKVSKVADLTVNIPVSSEADEEDLVPTCSIVAHIAVGDALAMVLKRANGWTNKAFADVHPGGTLGKRLNLLVGDLKPELVMPKVNANATIREVIMEISSKRMGAAAVCEEDLVLGIITDGDLRRMLEVHQDLDKLTAEDIMTKSPKFVASDVLAYDVLQLMEHHNISQILIIDGDIYKGVVHLHDLLTEGF